jgi:hypothetical protein
MISEASANAKENRLIREAERKRLLQELGPEPPVEDAVAEVSTKSTPTAKVESAVAETSAKPK